MRECTDLLPAGHKYTISIIGTSDKTSQNPKEKFTGQFQVSDESKQDIYQSPFKMRLISPRVAGRYKHSRWFANGNLKLDWYIMQTDFVKNANSMILVSLAVWNFIA
ncbi:hypothetical protein [Xenorhabdus kozodoii]|uniref:hypothetical protein n=1 Tax=Xenorhabdus kozodoii TaxID=351676 RepID=UPI001145EB5A|nr:hypothetical protein [Xenorhabdus kozodoii]